MKKILLTGAAGFIASNVAEKLLSRGCEVLGVDDLNDYYSPLIKNHRLEQLKKNPNFSFQKADIASREKMEGLIRDFKPEAIINLAARAGVRYSMVDPFIYMRTNGQGTLVLLEAARSLGVKKFILASTSSLYAGQKMPFSEELPVNEPISPYAASKKAAEAMCYTYHYLYGLDVTVFRYFTVYGPCGRPDMSVFKFIEWIKRDSPITVFGDGSQSRDFTYVDDIAKGTIGGLTLTGFQTVNLGGSEPHGLMEMVGFIEKYLGKKARIINKEFHKADMLATWADTVRAKTLLDWTPAVALEEGIRRTVEWHLSHRSLLDGISLED